MFTRAHISIFCMLLFKFSFGQFDNYVQNGNFERIDNCYIFRLPGWPGLDSINGGTNALIFSEKLCIANVPISGWGYQYPKSHNSFAGISMYCEPNAPTAGCWPGYERQYLKNFLKTKLVAGQVYCVSMYVNLNDRSSCTTDQFGFYFGTSSIDTIKAIGSPISYLVPQLSNPAGNFITDTVGWTLVSGTYTANGTEKYMVIGCFKSNQTINLKVMKDTLYGKFINMNIDEVSCIPVQNQVEAGPDKYSSPNYSVYIGKPAESGLDQFCYWYKLPGMVPLDTAAGMWVAPQKTSTFVVKQVVCGSTSFDTVVVRMASVGLLENLSVKFDFNFNSPADQNLGLNMDFDEALITGQFSLINHLGQIMLVKELELGGREFNVDVSAMQSGIYYCRLLVNNSFVCTKPVVIMH